MTDKNFKGQIFLKSVCIIVGVNSKSKMASYTVFSGGDLRMTCTIYNSICQISPVISTLKNLLFFKTALIYFLYCDSLTVDLMVNCS